MDNLREIDLRGIKEIISDFAKYIIIAVIAIIIFVYIVSFQQVLGPSMEPNYNEGEIYLLNKFKYKIFDVKRFDVIVLKSKKSKLMIKRIIGLPGDKIEYKNNKLYINDKEVVEEFKKTGNTTDYNIEKLGSNTVPENSYFVLGDNRENSEDSRVFGFITKDEIVGKVEFRLWPIVK